MYAEITIQFDEDNAAFEDSQEQKRLLDEAFEYARRIVDAGIPHYGEGMALVDTNGNTVGRVEIER